MSGGYYERLCALLRPLGVYRLDAESVSGAELWAAGAGLDAAAQALRRAERENLLATAEEEGLERWEQLLGRAPDAPTTERRREAVEALLRVGGTATEEEINRTIAGCGLRAEAVVVSGVIRVSFPDVIGVPDHFADVEQRVLEILPCHAAVQFVFRYLTWRECQTAGYTWGYAEEQGWDWTALEKAVPQ